MDDDICAMEELAAEEWRAGYRVKVPLVYDLQPETSLIPEEEVDTLDFPEMTPPSEEADATDEEIHLKELYKDIMRRVSERYRSGEQPSPRLPKFPEFLSSEPTREMEIVASLRPFGVRFIHYPENYADCSCCIAPQLMNYFEQRFIKPPHDRFDEDYFGDVNFQRFLKGMFDQFGLLHHSRTFTVIGSYSTTWSLTTYSSEITEQVFTDRSQFVAELKTRLEKSHSKAWTRSFLMCPKPYPTSCVIPMSEKDENPLPHPTFRESLMLTSSPELLRESECIDYFESTIYLDDFNSSASKVRDSIFETAFVSDFLKEDPFKDFDSSPVSSLENEPPIWIGTPFDSSDEELKTKDDNDDSNETIGEISSIEDTVEEEVYFCLQEILAVVLSECRCSLHASRENSSPCNSAAVEESPPVLSDPSDCEEFDCAEIETTTERRPKSDPPVKSIIELTPSGASFRKTPPKRCISLPPSGMGPSREESMFLANTIARLRPYGVRFVSNLESYDKCGCRPCSAISRLWKPLGKLSAVADFDMDRFGDMLLANLIAARGGSAALLLHFAGTFDLISVDRNRWTYTHNDYGEVRKQTFESEEPLFSAVEKRVSRVFNSQKLLEKFTCPPPEGMAQSDASSTMMEKTMKVKEDMKANMAKTLSTLENQKEILGKKLASFMTRIGQRGD